jgi:hypothetical protein
MWWILARIEKALQWYLDYCMAWDLKNTRRIEATKLPEAKPLNGMCFNWPREHAAEIFYGNPRHEKWYAENIVYVVPPYKMTYEGKPIEKIAINRKCAASLHRVLQRLSDAAGLVELGSYAPGCDKFSGSYNLRNITGGAQLSLHAYGAAIDFDAECNALGKEHTELNADHPLVKAFKDEGWAWGGDFHHRKDNMHFEAINRT